MPSYAITGGGLLGRALARALAEAGSVKILDIAPPDDLHGCETAIVDVRDRSGVTTEVRGADIVFHSAALHGPHAATHSDEDFLHTNVIGTANVLAASAQAGVRKVVFYSTTGIFGGHMQASPAVLHAGLSAHPLRMYPLTKTLAESVCEFYNVRKGLPCTVLRLGRLYEPRDRTHPEALYWALSGQLTSLTDAVRASLRAAEPDIGLGPHLILPTTIAQASDLPLDLPRWRALLVERGLVAPQTAPQIQSLPMSVCDASTVESAFGPFRHNQEYFIREALRA